MSRELNRRETQVANKHENMFSYIITWYHFTSRTLINNKRSEKC